MLRFYCVCLLGRLRRHRMQEKDREGQKGLWGRWWTEGRERTRWARREEAREEDGRVVLGVRVEEGEGARRVDWARV